MKKQLPRSRQWRMVADRWRMPCEIFKRLWEKLCAMGGAGDNQRRLLTILHGWFLSLDWCFTLYSGIFHLSYGDQYYCGRKTGRTRWEIRDHRQVALNVESSMRWAWTHSDRNRVRVMVITTRWRANPSATRLSRPSQLHSYWAPFELEDINCQKLNVYTSVSFH